MEAGHAVVTGAASGIGRAVALRLGRDGYSLSLLDIDVERLSATIDTLQEHSVKAKAYHVDLRVSAEIERFVAEMLEVDGPPQALVNNAGIGVAATIPRTELADWNDILNVNLTAPFLMCRALLGPMISAGGGVIVNVSSVAAVVGVANRGAYCASKAGVIGLTRAIAADHAEEGIRVNAICPGTVATEWIDKILANAPDPIAAREAMEERQLDGKMGTPEEVAAGVAFLLSSEARFVNGSAFVMDGGMSAV